MNWQAFGVGIAEEDYESRLLGGMFTEEPPGALLELGAHDSPLATLFAANGYDVVSYDLRPYDGPPHPRHRHVVGDFVDLWPQSGMAGAFDCAVCVSAIEHFGLGGYGERARPLLDVVAARYLYDALKPGGAAYFVFPYGGAFVTHGEHWRVYDHVSFRERIIQDFALESFGYFLSHPIIDRSGTVVLPVGSRLDDGVIAGSRDGFPGISALAKLRKPAKGERP